MLSNNKLLILYCLDLIVVLTVALFVFMDVGRSRYVISALWNQRDPFFQKIPKAYVVQSGSMEPAIGLGSIIVTYPSGFYSTGDVITFLRNGDSKNLITHRVEARLFPDGINNDPVYLTSGDANEDFDTGNVKHKDVIGEAVLTLPYLGYIANFAKSPWGFILLVIVPATIIVYEELKFLLKRVIEKFTQIGNIRQKGIPKIATAFPIFGAILVIIGLSSSFFNDLELSSGNIFQAAGPAPLSIAQTLVINEVLPDTSCSVGNTEAQWIELYNGFNFAINPKNFKITDGVNTIDLVTANNLSIPAGGMLLLSHNSAIWQHCYNDNGVTTGNLGGQLNIDTGHLQLIDTDGVTVIDDVQWAGQTGLTPIQNESIEREPDGLDSATGANFNPSDFTVRTTPQPGL